jgi:hypothetical protein
MVKIEEYDFPHPDDMICRCERPYKIELLISSDSSDRDTEEQFTATNTSLLHLCGTCRNLMRAREYRRHSRDGDNHLHR